MYFTTLKDDIIYHTDVILDFVLYNLYIRKMFCLSLHNPNTSQLVKKYYNFDRYGSILSNIEIPKGKMESVPKINQGKIWKNTCSSISLLGRGPLRTSSAKKEFKKVDLSLLMQCTACKNKFRSERELYTYHEEFLRNSNIEK